MQTWDEPAVISAKHSHEINDNNLADEACIIDNDSPLGEGHISIRDGKFIHPYKDEGYPPQRNKEDAWKAPKIYSNSGARNTRENSPPIQDLDNLNRVEKFYDIGKVKETQCIMYCDHYQGAQHSHGCDYIHVSARRAQVLEIDDSESIQENRNKALFVREYGIFWNVWIGLRLYSALTTFQSMVQKIQEEFKESSCFYHMVRTVAEIFVRFVFSIEVRDRNFDTFGVKPRVKLKLTCY